MDYTSLGIINFSPQDMILSDSNNSSTIIPTTTTGTIAGTTNPSGVVLPSSRTFHKTLSDDPMLGVLNTSDLIVRQMIKTSDRNANNTNKNYNNTITNNGTGEIKHSGLTSLKNGTKLRLKFSVDRLLGIEEDAEDRSPCEDHLDQVVGNHDSLTCSLNECHKNGSRVGYECCNGSGGGGSFANGSAAMPDPTIFNGVPFTFRSGLALMDLKSIVRPTPIRPTNHRINSVIMNQSSPMFSAPQQSMMKFHHPMVNGSLPSMPSSQFKSTQHGSIQTFRQITPSEVNCGNSITTTTTGKRKRSWSRAVFSNLQRKGLEIQFQVQKYITKPDRRKLAARLNLTDAQVKVWFQNRRMKWRHTRENLKSGQEKPVDEVPRVDEDQDTTSEEDEIDVVTE